MKKHRSKALRRLTVIMLAVAMILSALPQGGLSMAACAAGDDGDTAAQEAALSTAPEDEREHGIASIEVKSAKGSEDPRYDVSFGEDSDGKFDWLLSTYSSGTTEGKYMIRARAETEGDRIWAVVESKTALFHIYRYAEVDSEEFTDVAKPSILGEDSPALYIVVGTEEPTMTPGLQMSIDFHEDANSIYTIGQREIPCLSSLKVTSNYTGEEYALSPSFDMFNGQTDYEITVPFTESKINLTKGGNGSLEVVYEEEVLSTSGNTGTGICSIGIGGDGQPSWDENGQIKLQLRVKDSSGEYSNTVYNLTIKSQYVDPAITTVLGTVYSYSGVAKSNPLEIRASNGGVAELSYQWYSSETDSNEGGTSIEGANGPQYMPDTVDLGDSLFDSEEYYYCVVSYEAGGQKYETVSNVMKSVTWTRMDVAIVDAGGDEIPENGYEFYDGGQEIAGPTLTVEFDESRGNENGTWSYSWTETRGSRLSDATVVSTDREFTVPVYEGEEYSYRYHCTVTYTEGEQSKSFPAGNSVTVSKYSAILDPVVTVTSQPESREYTQGQKPDALSVSAEASGTSGNDKFVYQWQVSYDGENYEDIDDYLDYENINGKVYKLATNASYTPEWDNTDAWYRCKVTCIATNLLGDTFESEPVYSQAAHITYQKALGLEGDGTESSPYLIGDIGDLEAVRDQVNDEGNQFAGVYFSITSDITLPDGWVPIGTSDTVFCGNIDGAKTGGGNYLLTVAKGGRPLLGYVGEATLSNLDIYGEEIAGYGVVENYTVNRSIKRSIIIDNVNLKSGTRTLMSGYIGGFASGINEVRIKNCTVEEGVVIGYSQNMSQIGSFAGDFNGYIENCVSYADVYGVDSVGGIGARKGQSMGYCTVTNCEFYGNVHATGEFAGGILASGYYSSSAPNTPCVSVINCAVYGTVKGADKVGGIFGGEPVVSQCWDNGIGYIRDNYFGGRVISDGESAGAIVGYMNSLNRYNIIENNYYDEDCGAEDGIGTIKTIDTDNENVDRSDESVTYITSGIYFRSDDPLGADKENLTKSCTAGELGSGAVTAALNGRSGSIGNWVQGADDEPVHGSEKKVYRMFISDPAAFPASAYQGDELDLTGVEVELTYTDGSSGTVDGSELTISGYDKDSLGAQRISYAYGAAVIEHDITVLKRDVGDIKVYFMLLGDSDHGDNGEIHTLADGNLTTWIDETAYTVDGNSTVLDVFMLALGEKGISFTNTNGNYIEEITNGDVTVGEMTNGANSGWMYTINGVHSSLGVAEQYLNEGDVVVFHYTDDYTRESQIGGTTTAEAVIKAIQALPDITELTLDDAAAVTAANDMYNALTDDQKAGISQELVSKLTEAVLKIAELRSQADRFAEIYAETGSYLFAMADGSAIQVGSVGGEWMVIGLARAGLLTDEQAADYYDNAVEYVKANIDDQGRLHRARSTDNSRVILGLTAIGKDVTDVGGYNLLTGLSDLEYLNRQGINGPIWALIALDSHGYEIPELSGGGTQATRENIIMSILDAQLSDGGWALSGNSADPDMTAMAIQALAPYYDDNTDVREAIDKGLAILSEIQNEDGSYSSWGTTNSESSAQVVAALTAMGIDPDTDSRFIKNGSSALNALLSYALENGGFAHTAGGTANMMATEQGYNALVAYYRYSEGENALYDMRDVTVENAGPGQGSGEDQKDEPAAGDTGGQNYDNTQPVQNGQTGQNAKTGDDRDMPLYVMMGIGAAAIAIAVKKKRRNRAA